MDGQAGEFSQFRGKGLCLLRLRADISGKLERVADDDRGHSEPSRHPGERAQVFSAVVTPLQGENGLCRKTELV